MEEWKEKVEAKQREYEELEAICAMEEEVMAQKLKDVEDGFKRDVKGRQRQVMDEIFKLKQDYETIKSKNDRLEKSKGMSFGSQQWKQLLAKSDPSKEVANKKQELKQKMDLLAQKRQEQIVRANTNLNVEQVKAKHQGEIDRLKYLLLQPDLELEQIKHIDSLKSQVADLEEQLKNVQEHSRWLEGQNMIKHLKNFHLQPSQMDKVKVEQEKEHVAQLQRQLEQVKGQHQKPRLLIKVEKKISPDMDDMKKQYKAVLCEFDRYHYALLKLQGELHKRELQAKK